jgi:hypothetical protein
MDSQTIDQRLTFLRERLKMNKEFYRRESERNKRRSILVKLSVTIVGAIITIVLGVKSTSLVAVSSDTTSNIALLLSALVTILSVTDTTFDFRWVWINYSLTLTRIYGLEDELEYLAAGEGRVSAEQLDSIFNRLQATLAGINDSWMSRRLRNGSEAAEPAKSPPVGAH